MKPLRAGVIGLGVGKSHADGFLKSPHAELVALCDANEIRLEEMAHKFNVSIAGCYTSYEEMLAKANLDIVSVCLPNTIHAPASIAALNAGVHVICEKPMAPSRSDAEKMVKAAEKNRRKLMVCYNYRYRADSQWMFQVTQSGRLGQIYHASVSWRRETGIPGWGLFGSKEMSGGGAMIDLGVHVLDLALWMMGFPTVKTVSGETRMLFGPHSDKTWGRKPGQIADFDVDDGATGFLRLGNGASLFVQATWAEHTKPEEDRFRVEIQGTKGTAILDIPNYKREDTLCLYTEIENEPVTIIPRVRWNAPAYQHVALVMDVVEKLANGQEPTTSGQQGLVAVSILDALYESARIGREIVI